ncbi:hypothetical protein HU200_033126 [Digitaria exilis]|uniref:Peroxidase n=1 Tax=Digitaria exilis TaxID=1010633 RepID=A0A835EPN5_9POAL|nr:hypothetical protein HU200_033126 [Digitaria exilis]
MASRITQLVAILAVYAVASLFSTSAQAQLQVGYYRDSCNHAEDIVFQEVAATLAVRPYLAGSLLRLHFHDCFVRGCDGSILLNKTDDEMVDKTEREADTSAGLRGFDVIDAIKEKLEEACPGIVSCADILALVARDAVLLSHGPYWHVPTGRLDGRISKADATKDLPPPNSNITQLKAAFAEKNLTTKDLVVLSGAHTIGYSHCQSFLDRLTGEHKLNDAALELDPAYLDDLRSKCEANRGEMVEMSPKSSPRFDTSYYSDVLHRRGLFRSDAALLADDSTRAYVEQHATGSVDDNQEFFGDFGNAMVKMGNIQPVTTDGEVRTKCSVVNDYV